MKFETNICKTLKNYCHTRAPSWIFSLAENLASSSLQDGATKWLYYAAGTTHPPPVTCLLYMYVCSHYVYPPSSCPLPFVHVCLQPLCLPTLLLSPAFCTCMSTAILSLSLCLCLYVSVS